MSLVKDIEDALKYKPGAMGRWMKDLQHFNAELDQLNGKLNNTPLDDDETIRILKLQIRETTRTIDSVNAGFSKDIDILENAIKSYRDLYISDNDMMKSELIVNAVKAYKSVSSIGVTIDENLYKDILDE